jgi:hypothetical protein
VEFAGMDTLDMGRRIELVSMDRHCNNISLGLYSRGDGCESWVLVHSYAKGSAAGARVAFVRRALQAMAGMVEAGDTNWLRFPCGNIHQRPLKRAFLEICKLPSESPLEPKPLSVFDTKAGCDLVAESLGAGRYRIGLNDPQASAAERIDALVAGLGKLCEMEALEGSSGLVAFDCRTSHDALLSLLLPRALNIRGAMREEAERASRGILAAPSQQNL